MKTLLEELINPNTSFYNLIDVELKDYLWNLRMINIERLWESSQNALVGKMKIAILDSGIDLGHKGLMCIEKKGYNFLDDDHNLADDFGHGTKINGILASGGQGSKICGIVNNADVYNLKVIDKKGKGNIKHIIKALEWSIENKMDIVNMSIGHSMTKNNSSDEMRSYLIEERKLIKRAIDSGMIIIGAVGNIPEKEMQAPASYKGVIPVASYGVKNTSPVTFYSSLRNSKFNDETIFAPGEHILTTLKDGDYGYDSGSSMATIHVSAVVAYMKSIKADLTCSQIHKMLLETSSHYSTGERNIKILNVGRLIDYLDSLV